jgi:serine/threonine protein kinase
VDYLAPGAELQQYRIVKVLGSGGFSVVYLAQDQMLEKLFAIKEYFPERFAQRNGTSVRANGASEDNFAWGKARFMEEARVLARFDHPNIIPVMQIFEANNTAYTVLEYLPGRDFKAWLAEIDGPPNQLELDKVVRPVLDALEVIHRNDLLHRDIAPDNIYIRNDGVAVLLDFGSAKEAIGQRTRTVSAVVKDGYSPAEQYSTRGSGQGPWTDIYSLAATLYHAVTGVRPDEATERLLEDSYIPAWKLAKAPYRPGFLDAIDWGLRVLARDRPQSVTEWRAVLLPAEIPKQAPPKSHAAGSAASSENANRNRGPRDGDGEWVKSGVASERSKPQRSHDPRPVDEATRTARLLFACLGIPSAVLSAYLPLVTRTVFKFEGYGPDHFHDQPLAPPIYFAIAICLGLYRLETKRAFDLGKIVVAIWFTWTIAYQFAFYVALYLSMLAEGLSADMSALAQFLKGYQYGIAGILGGLVGGAGTAASIALVSAKARNAAFFRRTMMIGAAAGALLHFPETNNMFPLYFLLYLIWQPAVAWSIAREFIQPKP